MERYVDMAYQRDNEEPTRWAFCRLAETDAATGGPAVLSAGTFYRAAQLRPPSRSPLSPLRSPLAPSRAHAQPQSHGKGGSLDVCFLRVFGNVLAFGHVLGFGKALAFGHVHH